MLRDRILFMIIGTPLQRPAEGLQRLRKLWWTWRHPEFHELIFEDKLMKELIHRTITDGMNCVDIGCHLGSVLNEITRLSPRGKHIAVEPVPYKANWLRQKYSAVQIHNIALGDEHRTIEFFIDLQGSASSSLTGGKGRQKIEVPCRRLDDVIPPGFNIGFIKVDVEGNELAVLRGAKRVLTESKPLVYFECTRWGHPQFGFTAAQIFSFLNDEIRYHIFLPKDWLGGGSPLDLPHFEAAMQDPIQTFNFVTVPQK